MKTKFVVLFALFTAALPAAETGPRHAITHEDVWLMKRVGAPVPSPDGKWAVFSVTEPAYDAKDQWADLWLKSLADDSPARRLTYSKSGESGVNWSPDSTKIAFAAKRDGDEVAQLYVLPLNGGEAERITSLTLGASAPKWSPDGRQLLFVSNVYPGATDEEANKKAAKERKDRKYNARAYEQFPARFWNQWLDDRKPHPFVQEAKANVPARDLLAGTKLAASSGFGGSFGDDGPNLEAEWAPDGSAVLFVALVNREEGARANVNPQILQVAAAGGEPVRLTNDTNSYGSLSFSPDGRTLLCLTDPNTAGKVYDLSRLASFPWPFDATGRKVLTQALDRSVSRFAVPTGSDRIYFTFEHAGLEQLHSVSYAGGDVRDETSPATGTIGGLSAGGSALVGTWDSAVSPAEIYSFNGAPKARTSINTAKAATLDLLPLEHFTFKASDGREIHNMIVKPAGFDPAKKYPLFVVIHGGAANMWHDTFVLRWNYHLLGAPGYIVLLTDYKGSTGYGEEFARAIQFDPLKGPADEVNEAADEAIKRYSFIDGSRQAAGGASYGGHLANWLQATTTRYKCIISHAGEMDLVMQWGTSDSIFGREVNSGTPVWGDSKVWREQSPVMQGGNHDKGTGFVTPILITVGELDFRVPMNNALMNFATQQRLGVPSKLLVFPEAGHWILRGEDSRYWYGELHAWLAKYLK
ncbi:MAG: dipeptidyl aminopeptidase [Lacunisphaera sp.]|nr:dipeptidyl aminopeptidase [Lacunisphaera sp.]